MYTRDSESWLKHFDFILLDLICLQVAFVLAYLVSGYGFNPYANMLYRNKAIFFELTDLLVIFFMGPMKDVLKRGHYREFVVTIRHGLIVGALAMLYMFAFQEGQYYSRLAFFLFIGMYIIITYVVRELWKKRLRKKMVNGGDRTLLIIATEDIAEQVIKNIKEHNYARYIISGVAILGKDLRGKTIDGVPVVAVGEDAPEYICNEWVDEVFLGTSDNTPYPEILIEQLTETGVTLHMSLAKITSVPGKKQFVEKIGNYTVLTISINYASSSQLFIKRMVDILAGLAGCIATGIIFIFIGPLIYFSSPGPIFFSQERVGQNGKKFKMYKFRSMYMDAEERKAELMKDNKLGDGKMFKLDFDPRVIGNKVLPDGRHKTGVGNFIRSFSLDEFPQFYNVLKGDMSLVGTRPPLPSETSLYELHHHARLATKPGVTGMWQVSGRSDILDFEEVVKLDREYISNWSLELDIKIFVKTFLVVLKKKGSV
ncbi:MAG: sugar transferase [Lachnospiraceae bacterium]|nr:sugar transferase [Lachnospiraceae bacterium]